MTSEDVMFAAHPNHSAPCRAKDLLRPYGTCHRFVRHAECPYSATLRYFVSWLEWVGHNDAIGGIQPILETGYSEGSTSSFAAAAAAASG
ncbi:tumor necrosis factor receptor superfamily member 10B-like protein [Anopheles sinensis]|uniref:Tumor necrosis factor receptor superfamily member 10B-like protein n=1 Tax=Anopheles sinensis TaxID=74873 RepID=A0A084WP79_ANOSI|nr:tumor necrosis factor receptor superfamily member 10B-like protein [Anopheles sinensis]